MQDMQRTLVDLAGVFPSQFGERILTSGFRSLLPIIIIVIAVIIGIVAAN